MTSTTSTTARGAYSDASEYASHEACPPAAARAFASAGAPAPPQPDGSGDGAYFEEDAAGGFRKLSPGAWGARAAYDGNADTGADDEADIGARGGAPMHLPLLRALRRGALCVQGLQAGVAIVAVLIVAQYGDDGALVPAVARYAAQVRFLSYVLAVVAWLGAAEGHVAARRAVAEGNASATPRARGGAAAASAAAGALACYTAVLLTVWATMPCDAHLAAARNWAPDAVAAALPRLAPYADAYRVLIVVRAVAAIAGWLATASSQPVSPDVLSGGGGVAFRG